MKLVNRVTVTYHSRTVGTLSMTPDNRLCAFQYDKDWIANGFSISPLDLPLKPDLFIAKPEPFWGNFGVFEDSLPDGYGRYLLNRMLKKQGINGNGKPTIDDMITVGESIRIPRKKGMDMILRIARGCYDILSKEYHSIISGPL